MKTLSNDLGEEWKQVKSRDGTSNRRQINSMNENFSNELESIADK